MVATGIDYVASEHVLPARPAVSVTTSAPVAAAPAAPVAAESAENSLAALTQRMRENTKRLADLAAQSQEGMSATEAQAVAAAVEALAPAPQAPLNLTNQVGDVTIRPVVPKPPIFRAPVEAEGLTPMMQEEPAPARDFIPPAAERPVRAPRMPSMDDLPLPVRAQMEARQAAQVARLKIRWRRSAPR